MTRHEARIAVFSLIFESLFRSDESPEIIFSSAVEDRKLGSNEYVRNTYFGVIDRLDEIEKSISECADNWRMERMSKTALSILRLASFEILFTDIPPKVAINEAVEIAKEFADEQEGSFVNGILNKLAARCGRISSDSTATVSGN